MNVNFDETESEGNRLEEKIADDFLKKFVIVSESNTLDNISILIMLKAIPQEILDSNLTHTELFNFKIFQDSLIAFQNLDMVNAFEYFDEKNRERVQNVKEMLINQKKNLNQVNDIISHVKAKVVKNEGLLTDINFIQS